MTDHLTPDEKKDKHFMITISLTDNEWGQIVDGLTCRMEDYKRTSHYHQTGQANNYILEVNSAEEADGIAQDYDKIISKIRNQRREQTSR